MELLYTKLSYSVPCVSRQFANEKNIFLNFWFFTFPQLFPGCICLHLTVKWTPLLFDKIHGDNDWHETMSQADRTWRVICDLFMCVYRPYVSTDRINYQTLLLAWRVQQTLTTETQLTSTRTTIFAHQPINPLDLWSHLTPRRQCCDLNRTQY